MCIGAGSAVAEVVLGTNIRIDNLEPTKKAGSARCNTSQNRTKVDSRNHSCGSLNNRSKLLSSLPKPAGSGMKFMMLDMRERTDDTIAMYTKKN